MFRISAQDGGRLGRSLSLADTGTAASVPSTTFSAQCYKIRVGGTKQIYVRIGDGAQTAVIGDTLIGAGLFDYFSVSLASNWHGFRQVPRPDLFR
jgi:hypothetical protein